MEEKRGEVGASGSGTARTELMPRAGPAGANRPDVEPTMDGRVPLGPGQVWREEGDLGESWGWGVPTTAGTG